MAATLVHSTTADGSFSPTGKANWEAAHTISGGTAYSVLRQDGSSLLVADSALTFGGAAAGTGLSIAAGTSVTAGAFAQTITQTLNNAVATGGVQWTFIDTTSAAGYLPFRILGGVLGTTSLLDLQKTGQLSLAAGIGTGTTVVAGTYLQSVGGSVYLNNNAGLGLLLGASNATNLSWISNGLAGVGTGTQGSVAGSLSLTNLTTTATSSTGTSAIIDGSNVLRPLTSSERFKTNIQAWAPSDKEISAFLALDGILFDYQDNPARIEPAQHIPAKVEKQPSPILDAKGNAPLIDVIVEPAQEIPAWEIEPEREGVKGVLGFSAEKIHAAGLAQLINYDAQGLPYSLREHGLIAYLFAVVKRQEVRIAALESK